MSRQKKQAEFQQRLPSARVTVDESGSALSWIREEQGSWPALQKLIVGFLALVVAAPLAFAMLHGTLPLTSVCAVSAAFGLPGLLLIARVATIRKCRDVLRFAGRDGVLTKATSWVDAPWSHIFQGGSVEETSFDVMELRYRLSRDKDKATGMLSLFIRQLHYYTPNPGCLGAQDFEIIERFLAEHGVEPMSD